MNVNKLRKRSWDKTPFIQMTIKQKRRYKETYFLIWLFVLSPELYINNEEGC
jgi:hypothetical protein